MKDEHPKYRLRWKASIAEVDSSAWDRMAQRLPAPLLEWNWLFLMEDSGSISPENGWQPCHLTAWDGAELVGAAPLYIKGHSEGEFVFDYAWADVAHTLGIPYYPKMVGMSPVTPAVGYRFLTAEGIDEAHLTEIMIAEIDRFCRSNRLSGFSFLFVDPAWEPLARQQSLVAWRHQSFLWENRKFKSFEDYLAQFHSNQRRNIRREIRFMERQRLRMETFTGGQIPDRFFSLMYRYYERTNDRYGIWGCKYLTERFFSGLAERYRHRLLFAAAFEESGNDLPVGLSMLLTKGDRLYGRYWGCARTMEHLHFNACYYTPIQWAIEQGVRYFDPGAGSAHKIRRGFAAVANRSLHRFMDPRMDGLLRTHMETINRAEQARIDELNRAIPFSRKTAPAPPFPEGRPAE